MVQVLAYFEKCDRSVLVSAWRWRLREEKRQIYEYCRLVEDVAKNGPGSGGR